MKGPFLSFLVIALLSTTACSRPRSPVAATSAAPGDLAKEDMDKLQGTWRIETSVWNGVPERDVALSTTLIFQGSKLTWVDKDGIHYQEDTINLMPDQSPRAIDNWSKGLGQAAPGIYSLEGDTFRWCSAGGDNKVRPTSFGSPPFTPLAEFEKAVHQRLAAIDVETLVRYTCQIHRSAFIERECSRSSNLQNRSRIERACL